MAYVTIAGQNKIALKQGEEEVLNITHFVLANIDGLGNEPLDRITAMPDGGDIMATLPVSKAGYVNTNQVVYSLTMDSGQGDFDFNWIGLLDDDGVLIAVTHTPTIKKRKSNGPVPGNNLTRNFLIAFNGIQATTAIEVPAETWQIDFNTRLHGIDERERLSNYDIYGHEGFFDAGWSVVRQASTDVYDILPGIGYVGGIRIASILAQQITVSSPPASIWLDVSLQGDIADVSAVVSVVVDAVDHPDYTDGLGFNHYLTKIADIAANGDVTDVRVNADDTSVFLGLLDDHEAASDPHPQYLRKDDTVTQAAAEAGTSNIVRAWSPLRVKQAIIAASDKIPVSTVLPLIGDYVPDGWLKMNGAELSRTAYAALWAKAQTFTNFIDQTTKEASPDTYAGYFGDGDGSTTFTLPDGRAEFLEGEDDGRGVDVSRTVGSWSSQRTNRPGLDMQTGSTAGDTGTIYANGEAGESRWLTSGRQDGGNRFMRVMLDGSVTKPRSLVVRFVIKF